MSEYIERIENLIRVVASVADDDFNIIKCNECALGHATKDEYFIARNFKPNFSTYAGITDFFDISEDRARALFYWNKDYETRQHILSALRVLLMEKMAQEIDSQIAMSRRDGEEGASLGAMAEKYELV